MIVPHPAYLLALLLGLLAVLVPVEAQQACSTNAECRALYPCYQLTACLQQKCVIDSPRDSDTPCQLGEHAGFCVASGHCRLTACQSEQRCRYGGLCEQDWLATEGNASAFTQDSSNTTSPLGSPLFGPTSEGCVCFPGYAGPDCGQILPIAGSTNLSRLDSLASSTGANLSDWDPWRTCPACRASYADGVCNSACNTPSCFFDGGDCVAIGTSLTKPCPAHCAATFADGRCDSECGGLATCAFDGGDCVGYDQEFVPIVQLLVDGVATVLDLLTLELELPMLLRGPVLSLGEANPSTRAPTTAPTPGTRRLPTGRWFELAFAPGCTARSGPSACLNTSAQAAAALNAAVAAGHAPRGLWGARAVASGLSLVTPEPGRLDNTSSVAKPQSRSPWARPLVIALVCVAAVCVILVGTVVRQAKRRQHERLAPAPEEDGAVAGSASGDSPTRIVVANVHRVSKRPHIHHDTADRAAEYIDLAAQPQGRAARQSASRTSSRARPGMHGRLRHNQVTDIDTCAPPTPPPRDYDEALESDDSHVPADAWTEDRSLPTKRSMAPPHLPTQHLAPAVSPPVLPDSESLRPSAALLTAPARDVSLPGTANSPYSDDLDFLGALADRENGDGPSLGHYTARAGLPAESTTPSSSMGMTSPLHADPWLAGAQPNAEPSIFSIDSGYTRSIASGVTDGSGHDQRKGQDHARYPSSPAARATSRHRSGDHALWFQAAAQGREEAIRQLFARDPKGINRPDDVGRCPAHFACTATNLTMLRLLVEELGAFVDGAAPGWHGQSPLHVACAQDWAEGVNFLIQQDADLNLRDENGVTPLMVCVKLKAQSCLMPLLRSTRHYIFLEANKGPSRLRARKADAPAALLRAGQRLPFTVVDATDQQGWTALHYAAATGNMAAAMALLRHQANVNAANKHGATALHLAAREHHEPVIRALLQHGAERHIVDDSLRSAHDCLPTFVQGDLRVALCPPAPAVS